MIKVFIFLLMIYFHIIDDYCLQGILASMKQKKWWEDSGYTGMYKYDYIMALFEHSFSWAFSIMLPLAIYLHFNINGLFIIMFVLNAVFHAYVDNMKANKLKINLIQDQLFHIGQIIVTFCMIIF